MEIDAGMPVLRVACTVVFAQRVHFKSCLGQSVFLIGLIAIEF